MKLQRRQGFSLLEVMIALAVVSFLSFTVLQLVFTNLRATKSVEVTASLENLAMEVGMALKDPANCVSNLPNFTTLNLPTPLDNASIGLNQITLPSVAKPLVTNNAPLVNQPSTKVFINIDNIKPLSPVAYLASISLTLDKGQSFIGARNIVRRLPISLTQTTAGGPITSCNTFGPAVGGGGGGGGAVTPPVVCSMVGLTYDPVNNVCVGAIAGSGCGSGSFTCGGEAMMIPALADAGVFHKYWYILKINAECDVSIKCDKGTWSQASCVCH